MAIARGTVAEKIKPLRGSIVIRGLLGATTEAGELVSLQTDGFWDPAIATGVVLSCGIAVQGGVATEAVDIVTHGPIECTTGGAIGAIVYVSDTAGEIAETAGTKSAVVGWNLTATSVYVNFQTVAFA